jgi:hypothetical protein
MALEFTLGGRGSGKPEFLCSGSVLGPPLERSRSPGEDPEKQSDLFLGDLEREDPEAQPVRAKGRRGALNQWQR